MGPTGNVIWQYWETRGEKPRFIDGFHEIARRNAGVEIVLVTPESLRDYLPDIEEEIFLVEDIAHKADMIRTRLVQRYGGMWLDSDAVVLSDLNWLFDHLKDHEFVGFNNACRLQKVRPWVRVCCFLSRPQGALITRWVEAQRAKLSQKKFRWAEIGAEMLNAACLENRDGLEILPFERICPIGAKQVEDFMTPDDARAAQIVRDCDMVMLSNRSAEIKGLPLSRMSVEEIAAGDYLLARIVRRALDPGWEEILNSGGELRSATVEVDTPYGRIETFENDFITRQIRKFGVHTRPDMALLRSVAEPGDFVFDLGAHIGTYAIPLAQKIGSTGKLLAVEGNAETFPVLERNLRAANLAAETTALNALVALPGRHYALNVIRGNTGGAYFTSVEMGGVSTEAVTIDVLCERFFTPRIIKIDIEGGELSALSTAELLKREPPILYAEINCKALRVQDASVEDMEKLLRDRGYRCFRNMGKRHAAHDEFIVSELASFPTDLNNFDVLAIHARDPRLRRVTEMAQ